MARDNPAPPTGGGQHKITAKDVASTTAIGSAVRLGAALHKGAGRATATGVATGAADKVTRKRAGEPGYWLTALVVAGVMFGTLALMIVFGK